MVKRAFVFFIVLMTIPVSGFCQKNRIHIATDQSYWYPFTYSENVQAKGIHVDIVKKALSNLNYDVQFYPRPWRRCLKEAKTGKYDAVVSASYNQERAQYLIYPEDAKTAVKSEWRITQVEYVLVTHTDSAYNFNGNVKTLPQPVRAVLGYSIAQDMRSVGLVVVEAPDFINCAIQLVKSQRGSLVTPPQTAQRLSQDDRFKAQLKIHSLPIKSKSYFMVFTVKNQSFSREEMVTIWREIVRLREDQDYLQRLFDKYQGK
ncbi:MAG: transporter substrate-binding domain-containing protein [Desulfobacteraceae bacterium]|nr:transporter substrate-binding domain-containing protein [Desulfobacteraceae bacterium]